jgi:hypothetical protein
VMFSTAVMLASTTGFSVMMISMDTVTPRRA